MKYLLALLLLVSCGEAIPKPRETLFRIYGTNISCKYYSEGNVLRECTSSGTTMFNVTREYPVIYNATNIIGPEQ